jgi:hypothetical protein
MWCAFNVRTAEPSMRRRWSGLPRGHSRSNLRKRNARDISTLRWSVICIVADQRVGVGVARRRNGLLLALTQRLAPNAVARYPSAPYALGCDYCATACRDLIVGWTYSTQNELASLSSLCAVKRRAGVCRPMQVTVRINPPTARDEQGWRVHQRYQPTGDVWGFAGSGLQSKHRDRVVPWSTRATK